MRQKTAAWAGNSPNIIQRLTGGMNHESDRPMNEMEHIRSSGTFELFTPPPAGYETESRDNIFAVDPKKIMPTLYFSFRAWDRGWHIYQAP